MTVRSDTDNTGDGLTIAIEGRFDFSAHKEFRDAYEGCDGIRKYKIDMREANYIDSSALGMLLLLRDHAGGDDAQVEIVNCNDDIRKILAISNFEQLFKIH